jgi:hypothetical protein
MAVFTFAMFGPSAVHVELTRLWMEKFEDHGAPIRGQFNGFVPS